jgi:lysozyme family protein
MRSSIATCLKLIAGSEGGYSNNPKDPGGPTMRGVTLVNYQRYCATKKRPKPGIAELKKITTAEVEEIFRDDYWDRVRGDDLPTGLDYAVVDFGFNSGPGQAVKELQRVVTALGADAGGADGKIGSGTLSAVKKAIELVGIAKVINEYQDKRLAFMEGLKNWSTFKDGWTSRVTNVRMNALAMANAHPAEVEAGTIKDVVVSLPGVGAAKADPAHTAITALPGGTSIVTTVGGAVATAVATAAPKILDLGSQGIEYLPYAVGGFVILTVVAGVITAVMIKRKPKEEGVV